MKFIRRLFKKWEKKKMITYVTSFVRHGLTFVGGLLVAKGYVEPEAAEAFVSGNLEIVVGLISYAVGQLLSFKSK